MLFYCGLLSISDEDNYETILSNNTIRTETVSSQVNFLQNSIIYLVSILYVASRLFTTLNLIYIPLYINERNENETHNSINEGDREGIASFPLVCYVASFLTAFFLKFQTSKVNKFSNKTFYRTSFIKFVEDLRKILREGSLL